METPTADRAAALVARRARTQDVPTLVKIGAGCFADAPCLHHLTFSPTQLAATLQLWIKRREGLVLVAEVEREIAGAAIGLVSKHWLASEVTAYGMGLLLAKDIDRQATRLALFEAFQAAAIKAGAQVLSMTAMPAPDGDSEAALFRAKGMHSAADSFEMALAPASRISHTH